MSADRGRAPAAEATARILRLLSARGTMSAATIARELGLARSTVYELLGVLCRHGFVVHLQDEQSYGLGAVAFELGSAYSRQAPVARLGRPVLAGLARRTAETCHLAVLHGKDVFYVVEEKAARRPPLVTNVGVRLPAHLTASGRSILAYLPAAQLLALFPHRDDFVDRTGRGPRRLSELRGMLAAVRRRGFAVEDGDVTEGFASVAAPVLDHRGFPVAGLACTFESAAYDETRREAFAVEVLRAARELGSRFGAHA